MDEAKKAVRRLGKRINELRESAGMNQLDLAAAVDVEQSYVSRIESGKISPSFPRLYRIATALGVTVSQLTEGV